MIVDDDLLIHLYDGLSEMEYLHIPDFNFSLLFVELLVNKGKKRLFAVVALLFGFV